MSKNYTMTVTDGQLHLKIDADRVMTAYSGKANACRCGCSGKYRFAKAHLDAACAARGYDIGKGEVNDRSVAATRKKIEDLVNSGEKAGLFVSDEYVSVDHADDRPVPDKTYTIYFAKPEIKASAASTTALASRR